MTEQHTNQYIRDETGKLRKLVYVQRQPAALPPPSSGGQQTILTPAVSHARSAVAPQVVYAPPAHTQPSMPFVPAGYDPPSRYQLTVSYDYNGRTARQHAASPRKSGTRIAWFISSTLVWVALAMAVYTAGPLILGDVASWLGADRPTWGQNYERGLSVSSNPLAAADTTAASQVETAPSIPADLSDLTVARPPSVSAATIDQWLGELGSPAEGTGAFWVAQGLEHGIDPVFAVAFFQHESSSGVNPAWAGWKDDGSTTHNVGNIICAGYATCYGRFRDYASWEEGIADWYRLIKVEYLEGRGHRTVADIIPVYAPAFENDVQGYINAVQRTVSELREREQQQASAPAAAPAPAPEGQSPLVIASVYTPRLRMVVHQITKNTEGMWVLEGSVHNVVSTPVDISLSHFTLVDDQGIEWKPDSTDGTTIPPGMAQTVTLAAPLPEGRLIDHLIIAVPPDPSVSLDLPRA